MWRGIVVPQPRPQDVSQLGNGERDCQSVFSRGGPAIFPAFSSTTDQDELARVELPPPPSFPGGLLGDASGEHGIGTLGASSSKNIDDGDVMQQIKLP
jgi:hypothetical protein